MKPRPITIKDVAREAGVSYSTVSRVLNGYPHVHPDKRRRIQEAVDRLGYAVNIQARSLAGGRSNVIGLLIHEPGDQYTAHVIQGADEILLAAQYELMLHTTHKVKEAIYANRLVSGLIDGLVVLLPMDSLSYLEQLRDRHFPHVVINDHDSIGDLSPAVGITNREGAYAATRYLLELGHRRIGFLKGLPVFKSAAERLEAFRAAHTDYGVPFDPELVREGRFSLQDGYSAALELLNHPSPPTAIFAANDLSAFGAYNAARSLGLCIPEDVSIIGFDDLTQSAYMHPPLTTVHQPMIEMGRLAAEILLRQIEEPERPLEQVVLPVELIVRGSCAPPHETD